MPISALTTQTHSSSPFKHLYKILPSQPPFPLPDTLPLSDLDISSGYIHLSTALQVPLTAERFFRDARKLWVLRLKVETFDEVMLNGRVEMKMVTLSNEESDVFPHLHEGKLGRGVVEEVLEFERVEHQGEIEDWIAVLSGLEL